MRFDRRKPRHYNSKRRRSSRQGKKPFMVDGRARHGFSPERIHAMLRKLGCSQADLARRLGVPRNTLNNWIKGIREPNAAAVMRLRQVEQEIGNKA